MASTQTGFLRSLLLVAVGAAMGGVSGWFASELAREPVDVADVRILEERVATIEERVPAATSGPLRKRDRVASEADAEARAASGARAATGERDLAERIARSGGLDENSRAAEGGGDGVVPRAPPPEFVDLVRSAIEEIKRQDRDKGVEARVEDQRKKYVYEVDKKLHNYREALGLSDEQVAAFREVAIAGFDERLAAQQAGTPQPELQALDRKRHRAFRDVIGGAAYREFRKKELDSVARPTIVSIAGQAGVDREQRDRIERLLDQHIESLVDLDVKLRTEELDAKERAAIHERMQQANRSAWDRLRGNILDADQRERVPKRLR